MKALTLPWTGRNVPHAILDINRGCDIRCLACYNARPPENKTTDSIAADLDGLMKLRNLHTVTIAGGEPLLHPELDTIIRLLRSRGLRVAMASNGRGLDRGRAASLAEAGLDLVLLHIDPGQVRLDLADTMDRGAVRDLRLEKLALLSNHGITAGLLSTIFGNAMDDIAETVQLLLETPAARYLVFTGHADFPRFGTVKGTMEAGMHAEGFNGKSSFRQVTNVVCGHFMEQRFDARPFAKLPSKGGCRYDSWLSYLAVVAYDEGMLKKTAFLTSSLLERVAIPVMRSLTGRHVFFHDESAHAQRIQLVLNALSGGRISDNLRMLRCEADGHELVSKHIVFQQGPTPDETGQLSVCGDCPDAVILDGRLLPVCLADRWSDT